MLSSLYLVLLLLLLSPLLVLLVLGCIVYRQVMKPLPPVLPVPPPTFTVESERSIRRGPSSLFSSSPPPAFDVIVIGSGLGGLTAASLLAQTGRRVLVLEQHDVAGGCCHTYTDSKGVEHAVGVHYVGGEVWRRRSVFRLLLDAVTGGHVDWQEVQRDEDEVGQELAAVYDVVYFGERRVLVRAGTRRYMHDLISAFPAEEEAIRQYVALTLVIRKQAQLHFLLKNLLPEEVYTVCKEFSQPDVSVFLQYCGVSTLQQLQSMTACQPLIDFLSYIHFDFGSLPSSSSFAAHAVAHSYFYRGTAYPVGGPSQIAKAAVAVIERAGGQVLVRSEVQEVMVADGRVTGVRLRTRGGAEAVIPTQTVVSSAGAFNTYCRLLSPLTQRLVPQQVRELQGRPGLAPAAAHFSYFFAYRGDPVALGIPSHNVFNFPAADVSAAGQAWLDGAEDGSGPSASLSPACFIQFACRKDPSYAARHPGVIAGQVLCEGNWSWVQRWQDWEPEKRGAEYDEMKAAVQEELSAQLLHRFPQLQDCELISQSLGSAASSQHYLAAAGGSSYGLQHSVNRLQADWLRCGVDTIHGLYLSGTDVTMAGLEGATMAGFLTAAAIDKRVLWRNLNRLVTPYFNRHDD